MVNNEIAKQTGVEGAIEVAKKFKNYSVDVVGPKKVYQHRYTPIKLIRDGIKEIKSRIVLDDENQKILVEFYNPNTSEWLVCGHVNPEKSATCKSEAEIREILAMYSVNGELPEMEGCIREINSKDKSSLSLIMELKIFGQTEMEALMEEMAEGFDQDKFDELQEFIGTLKVSQPVATAILEEVKNTLPQDAARIPGKTVFNNDDEVMEDVVYSITAGSNTMLEGPMAAGKNTCLEALAYQYGKALYEVQVNSYIDNDVLLGTRTIVAKDGAANADEINEQGRKLIEALAMAFTGDVKAKLKADIEKHDVAAVEAVQDASGVDFSVLISAMKDAQTEVSFQPGVIPIAMERGSWVVVDEFNAGPPAVMAVLNSVLDARRRIQVPGYGLVKAAPGFRLFATMNPNYEGTFTLNAATSSRFNHVTFKASENITPIILSRVPNATKDFLKVAEKCYKKLRNGIDTGVMQDDSINVRGFIEAAKMNVLGRSVKRSLITCVVNGIPDMDDRKALKDFIDIEIA
jgi:MoxR-like ATPase